MRCFPISILKSLLELYPTGYFKEECQISECTIDVEFLSSWLLES